KRQPIRRSPKSHVLRSAAGLWPKRGSPRPDETERDGDSSVRPDQLPHFGKCRRPKRDCPSSTKISYQLLQDVIDLGTSTRFDFSDKRLMQIYFGQHSYGEPNVITRAFAYAKFFSCPDGAVIRVYYVTLIA